MKKETVVRPLKPKPVQTLIAFALLFQVKDKLKRENWMVAREIVSANQYIFSRIKQAIERDYNYDVTNDHLYEAVVMLLQGLKIEIVQRPKWQKILWNSIK